MGIEEYAKIDWISYVYDRVKPGLESIAETNYIGVLLQVEDIDDHANMIVDLQVIDENDIDSAINNIKSALVELSTEDKVSFTLNGVNEQECTAMWLLENFTT